MSRTLRSLCVYCGARPGRNPAFLDSARSFGGLLARRGINLVFGGSHIGLMGALADGALVEGGRVVGVIPRALVDRELAHRGLTELVVVDSMHERKAAMERRSDAFVALPGGSGTLDELFEIWTWRQLGIHHKPVGLLDLGGYWQPLLACLEHLVAEGFSGRTERDMLLVESDPGALLDRLAGE